MRMPSLKTLESKLTLTREQARLIRKLGKATDDAETLRALIEAKCPATHDYARRCYNDPFASHMWRVTMALHAIDGVLGTCGVEAIGEGDSRNGYAPPYEYCNTGDSYAATLIYKRATNHVFVGGIHRGAGALAARVESAGTDPQPRGCGRVRASISARR